MMTIPACIRTTWIAGVLWIGVLPVQTNTASAQDCTEVELLANWDGDSGFYADVWAVGDFAFVAQLSDNKVHFFDISDPRDPIRFLEWAVGSPNESASAQDVKVANGLLFIALETSVRDGVEIVDVRDPFNPVHLSWIDTPGFAQVYNCFYDNGYLYLADNRSPEIGIVDLTGYDPDNPPFRISRNHWVLGVGGSKVRDMTVRDGRLYVAAWDSGVHVFDVTDITTKPPIFLGSDAPAGPKTNALWPSDDGRWLVVAEERMGGALKLFEILPEEKGVAVVERDRVTQTCGDCFSPHNPVVVGTRVYVAWYQAGLQIYDIHEDTASLVEVASYDTFPDLTGAVNGAWGVYPFLGEERMLVSDTQFGLYVLNVHEPLFHISYPDGLVKTVHRQDGATLRVRVTPACAQPDLDALDLVTRIDPAGVVVESPLTPVGGTTYDDLYEAEMPRNVPCTASLSYYVRANALGGGLLMDPPGAPDVAYSAEIITDILTLFEDDIEDDLGWTVGDPADTADDGIWVRGDPIGTIAQPEVDHTPAPGTICWFTGQGPISGGANLEDVDNGRTTLMSPMLDLSAGGAEISYWRWFSNDRGDGANEDPFVVDISNDGGVTWHNVETLGPIGLETSGGWVLHQFAVDDFVSPSAETIVRFVASDEGKPSLVEAAIDDFLVLLPLCESCDDGVLNQGEERIDCGGPCAPCECLSDQACDNNVFCDGTESCDAFGHCRDDTEEPCPVLFCSESADACVQCLNQAHCDDGLFCSGAETCDDSGSCQPGGAPCPGQFCSESQDKCHDCRFAADCPDDEYCLIFTGCTQGFCAYRNRLYGDVNDDGVVGLSDILCVLDGFQNNFDRCTFEDNDISGDKRTCIPDGSIDLFDILGVLDAFQAISLCCPGD